MAVSTGTRKEKVGRWISKLPPCQFIVVQAKHEDEWITLSQVADPTRADSEQIDDACQSYADEMKRTVSLRVVATLEADGKEVVLPTRARPSEDVDTTDVDQLDGSSSSQLSQLQRHNEGLWRMGLQQQRSIQQAYQSMFEQQQALMLQMSEMLSQARESDQQWRENFLQLQQDIALAEEESEGQELPPQLQQMLNMVAARMLMPSTKKKKAEGEPEAGEGKEEGQ